MSKVAEANDLMRTTMSQGPKQKIMLTQGVRSSPNCEKVLKGVRETTDFGEDPYGEHDFGALAIEGTKYFWKFDYYAPDLVHGADPETDEETVRVLTIMEASEY